MYPRSVDDKLIFKSDFLYHQLIIKVHSRRRSNNKVGHKTLSDPSYIQFRFGANDVARVEDRGERLGSYIYEDSTEL